jgi:hypothetical protein
MVWIAFGPNFASLTLASAVVNPSGDVPAAT